MHLFQWCYLVSINIIEIRAQPSFRKKHICMFLDFLLTLLLLKLHKSFSKRILCPDWASCVEVGSLSWTQELGVNSWVGLKNDQALSLKGYSSCVEVNTLIWQSDDIVQSCWTRLRTCVSSRNLMC